MAYKDHSKYLEWIEKNKDRIRIRARENCRRYRNDPVRRTRYIEAQHRYRSKPEFQIKRKKDQLELKITIFSHYSKNVIQCEICGENRLPCLSLDHINGGGGKHRKEVGGGRAFYIWIKKNNYPDGYRVLCMNCQFLTKAESG